MNITVSRFEKFENGMDMVVVSLREKLSKNISTSFRTNDTRSEFAECLKNSVSNLVDVWVAQQIAEDQYG